ncbi:alpha/beta fold hydrolase [Ornithinibacillus bavariensis]|uniref:Alpha/beta hydrolase n=1 Tax=Ornithinibacillus bavariensis TaxID=545502 RepID=A0A920C599_9BACI|nr:alpha/beta hydrolase [Ornithinibacillus bavariensis]GIO26591.1 alpha/beta hydrolase [Ornithinibacillus bavariensis]HAM81487.1 alpha/beta hydrolase [Ornithinibacillus sp.]
MNTLISKDGTKIAYKKQGSGPSLILVASAAADHKDAEQLAVKLASHFTVYNYDRRGRGQSTDSSPYAVEREVEDIEALINEAGGKCFLFGSSSGAVLAIEAASKLEDKVIKLFMYEPPFIIDDSRPPVPANYVQHLNHLIEEGKRNEAVEYYMSEALGIPSEYLEYVKADPSWKSMEGMAHTLAYDGMIMGETQSGNPLPVDRWKMNVPTSVMVGENSEPYFHDAAKSLVNLLPVAKYQTLSGQDHSAVMMAPDVLAKEMVNFYLNSHHDLNEVSI